MGLEGKEEPYPGLAEQSGSEASVAQTAHQKAHLLPLQSAQTARTDALPSQFPNSHS
jgi:hypothetical protein